MFQQIDYSTLVAMHAERLRQAAANQLVHEAEMARPGRARGQQVRFWAGRGLVALGRRLQMETPIMAQPGR